MVDTKRGYVDIMCNGRSAQQKSGVALSKNSVITREAKCTMSVWISRETESAWCIPNVETSV